MLVSSMRDRFVAELAVDEVRPPFFHRCTHLPLVGRQKACHNMDRWLCRFLDYPRLLRRDCGRYDVFHICDHSYAHLIHDLPASRCGVLCADLDTFRCLLEPQQEPRPPWFRRMTRRILDGLQKAVVVFHTTAHVRSQIERFRLIDPKRLVHAPLGIAPEFLNAFAAEEARPRFAPEGPYLLHVGSCIPRKRIDVLLNVVAGVRARCPRVRLVKVSGNFSNEQRRQIARQSLDDAVVHLTDVPRKELASLYRHAAATLVPSDREGFGLPVIEALACGSIVVANDLPPLREGGGNAAVYCPISNLDGWIEQVVRLIDDPASAPAIDLRRSHARQFTWETHARIIGETYLQIARGEWPPR
jgi:glycosyltransferase involved in cell wall biosynthesis